MSMKKNALAVALVAGLGLAGVAAAYTIQTNNDDIPERVATADITSNASIITMAEAVNVEVDALDFIVGRTTGFNVRVELSTGTFASNPTVVTAPGGAGSALPTGWTVVLLAGGTGNTFAVYGIQPPSTTPVPAIQPGELFRLSGVQLTDLASLQTSGNSVLGTARFIDPVGANEIGSDNTVLLQSGNPVAFGCDPAQGEVNERIDVAVTTGAGSKTYFSADGSIGGSNDPLLGNGTTNLGAVTVSRAAGFSSFTYAPTDSFTTVVTGTFGAFFPTAAGRGMFLSSTANCATPITATTAVNAAETQVTFTYTAANAGFSAGAATGGTLFLCAQVPAGNTQVIDASNVNATTTFNRTGVPAVNSAVCGLLPLQYNGSDVRVYNVNPAGNTTAQSFIRVINQSSTGGTVRIVARDDNGTLYGPISFNLPAQRSVQLNSEDLENGNAAKGLAGALGDGTGRWRLVVTGEFSGMVVQSLNRNTTDGTVTNLTDADTRGEQVMYDLFE